MATFSQKELKQLVKFGLAIDATKDTNLIHERRWWIIGYSKGKYGINGCLICGESKKLYAITARSSSLFYYV